MSDQELKLCPFCGGEAFTQVFEPHSHSLEFIPDHPGSASVECANCPCGILKDTLDDAIRAWNTRTPDPMLEERGRVKEKWEYSAAQVEAMGWRPIEEAPTDGAWILAVNAKTNPGRLHVVQYSERHGRLFPWVTDSSFPMSFVDGLTHFMFLPQPPVTK